MKRVGSRTLALLPILPTRVADVVARRQASAGADALPGNPRPWGGTANRSRPNRNRIATCPWLCCLGRSRGCASPSTGSPATSVCLTRLHEIVHERRRVSAETAIALGAYFLQTPEYWMNAQTAHELSRELVQNGSAIRSRIRRHAADRAAT